MHHAIKQTQFYVSLEEKLFLNIILALVCFKPDVFDQCMSYHHILS